MRYWASRLTTPAPPADAPPRRAAAADASDLIDLGTRTAPISAAVKMVLLRVGPAIETQPAAESSSVEIKHFRRVANSDTSPTGAAGLVHGNDAASLLRLVDTVRRGVERVRSPVDGVSR